MITFAADQILHLFGGNMSAYGHDDGFAVHEPVTPHLVKAHLQGNGIGIYPMWYQSDTWLVKWGCCDIDTGDWSEAYGLAVALRSMGFTPFIERSRSKGWHVWVFSDGPVEAKHMRRALKVAYAACELQAREANPKAEELRVGQLGNYVRLPFKNAFNGPLERQVMMQGWDANGDGTPIQCVDWLSEFDQTMRLHPDSIRYWSAKWREPERKRMAVPKISEERIRRMFTGMKRDLFDFIKDGPGPTADRSEALVALAFKLKKEGYTPEEIFEGVKAADLRWGKYNSRVDADIWLCDIVERVL